MEKKEDRCKKKGFLLYFLGGEQRIREERAPHISEGKKNKLSSNEGRNKSWGRGDGERGSIWNRGKEHIAKIREVLPRKKEVD